MLPLVTVPPEVDSFEAVDAFDRATAKAGGAFARNATPYDKIPENEPPFEFITVGVVLVITDPDGTATIPADVVPGVGEMSHTYAKPGEYEVVVRGYYRQ
jgi:hypothetical protein